MKKSSNFLVGMLFFVAINVAGVVNSQEKSLWCVKPEFSTSLSITYEEFKKLDSLTPSMSENTEAPGFLDVSLEDLRLKNLQLSKYLVPFKKFTKPVYLVFDRAKDAYLVYANESTSCVYPVAQLSVATDKSFPPSLEVNSSTEKVHWYTRNNTEYDGGGSNIEFSFIKTSVVKLAEGWDSTAVSVIHVPDNADLDFGTTYYPKIGLIDHQNNQYYVTYPGTGVLKIWDLGSGQLKDEVQLYEKLGAPTFYYLHLLIDGALDYGGSTNSQMIFGNSCENLSRLNKDWVQDHLSKRKKIKDNKKYTGGYGFRREIGGYSDYLLEYYDLIYKDGAIYLKAQAGYLKDIQKMKTCLKDFPEITYPPNQELVEVYRFPGATGNKSFFQKIKETFSKKK
jgi:hypothetical protein